MEVNGTFVVMLKAAKYYNLKNLTGDISLSKNHVQVTQVNLLLITSMKYIFFFLPKLHPENQITAQKNAWLY